MPLTSGGSAWDVVLAIVVFIGAIAGAIFLARTGRRRTAGQEMDPEQVALDLKRASLSDPVTQPISDALRGGRIGTPLR